MKIQFFTIAALILVLTGCGSKDSQFQGYGYSYTYPSYNANTNAGSVAYSSSYYPSPTSYYYPTYNRYYPYYNYPRYTYAPYYTPSSYWYPRIYRNPDRHFCQLEGQGSKLNLSFESTNGFETRSIIGENLRAQTFGQRTEIEYGSKNEKLNLLTDQTGHTFISGKLMLDGQTVRIEPKNQKCKSTRTKFEEDPQYEIATFDCADANLKIRAEVLIPKNLQDAGGFVTAKSTTRR